MLPLPLLLFLKNNWLAVGMGVLIAILLIIIGVQHLEINHKNSQIAELNLVIDTYKAKEVALEKENKRITDAHAETLKRYVAEVQSNLKLTQEKIKANAELKRVTLSLQLVQLWNESKRNPDSKDSPSAKQGDDGASSGTTTVATATLEDLFRVSAENDARHWACVKQVNEWIDFWGEYSQAVRLINPE